MSSCNSCSNSSGISSSSQFGEDLFRAHQQILPIANNSNYSDYQLNYDPNPVVVKKKSKPVNYVQKVNVKYLRPPTPPPPGDIIIRQERAQQAPAAPPLVIRAHPPRSKTPPPILIRDPPPQPPAPVPPVVISVPGKRIPPPPRKVILEKYPQMPNKPPEVFIEKWLPYKEQKRRIVFEKSCDPEPLPPQKNVLIEWEPPQVNISQDIKFLGIERANPNPTSSLSYRFSTRSPCNSGCSPSSGSNRSQDFQSGGLNALNLFDSGNQQASSKYELVPVNNNSSSREAQLALAALNLFGELLSASASGQSSSSSSSKCSPSGGCSINFNQLKSCICLNL